MSLGSNRRQFLKASAAAGVGYWVAAGTSMAESTSALERINFGCIGVGGKGQSDSGDAARHGNIVAMCDIDDGNLGKAAARFAAAEKSQHPKKYNDFRKMLDEIGKSIDAVTVSTPDHTHAPAAVRAMRQGLHVFCQKPMTHSLTETRLMGNIAREKKLVTQMGNQGTADSGLRRAAALLEAGVIGNVKEVHAWSNRPVWPQGIGRPKIKVAIPDHVHWDEWIGPAEMRAYHPAYHPFKWRGWWEFGTGALGDMACHTMNLAFMGLNLRDPISVQAKSAGHNKQTFPKWSTIDYHFAALGKRQAVKMTWYDGGKMPPMELLPALSKLPLDKNDKPQTQYNTNGALFIGDKGTFYAPGSHSPVREAGFLHGDEYVLLKDLRMDVDYTRSPGHFKEWTLAIQGKGPEPRSNFPNYATPLTETVLLGNLAIWAEGKKIQWDAKNQKATNAPEVGHIIRKKYRKGYEVF